jgi:hypothetical protein
VLRFDSPVCSWWLQDEAGFAAFTDPAAVPVYALANYHLLQCAPTCLFLLPLLLLLIMMTIAG